MTKSEAIEYAAATGRLTRDEAAKLVDALMQGLLGPAQGSSLASPGEPAEARADPHQGDRPKGMGYRNNLILGYRRSIRYWPLPICLLGERLLLEGTEGLRGKSP